MTEAEARQLIKDTLAEINGVTNPVEYTKKLTGFLSRMHPSDAYTIIRDEIVPKKNTRISSCKSEDMEAYQMFQDLQMNCKASFDHDRALATNLDVDKAVSKAYGIAMRTLRANMDLEQERFDKITSAINRIEEHLGLDVTDFREGVNNDSTNNEDAQRVEEATAGTGEIGETE